MKIPKKAILGTDLINILPNSSRVQHFPRKRTNSGSESFNDLVHQIQRVNETENEFDDLDFFTEDDEFEKNLLNPDIKFTNKDSLILVSFKLPVCCYRQNDGSYILKESNSMLYSSIYRLRQKGFSNF